jgi:hypothetical protein
MSYFSLSIYRYINSNGQTVFVPSMQIEETVAREKGFELRETFQNLSAMQCSTLYNTAMKLRWKMDEQTLLSKLKKILN